MIYLDHNATTPLAPEVLDRVLPFLREAHGNASSVHSAGQRARHAVDDARDQVAGALRCAAKEIVFTSGGTEADNLALRGVFATRRAKARRIVTTAVEHPAVLETARALAGDGAELVELGVDGDGRLAWEQVEAVITPDVALVSMMWVNNETGVVFPVEKVGELCRKIGVPFHVDAVQAAGKLAIDLSKAPIDLLSISAHKINGPKGAGALFVRRGVPLWAAQTGGHQERGRRGGTENVPAVVGFGEAAERAGCDREARAGKMLELRQRFESGVLETIPNARVMGADAERISNTSCICLRGVEGEALLMALDLAGICVSSGSACTSGSLEPSHVIRAMGVGPDWARGAIRFSFGAGNTVAEIETTLAELKRSVEALRR